MADISSITVGGTNYTIKDSNAIRKDSAISGDIILAANNNYSFRPASNGYCSIGESSYRFATGYINSLYVNNIYALTELNGTSVGTGTSGQVLTSAGSGKVYWKNSLTTNDYIAKNNGIFSGYLVPDLGSNLAGYLGKSGNYITGAYISSLYPVHIYAADSAGSSVLGYGTAGQVLTSNGFNTVYWSTPSSSGGTVSGDYLPLSGGTITGAITFAENDSYGIFPSTTNYCSIGSSSAYFYRSYINNMYVGSKIYASSSSSDSTKTVGSAGQVLTSGGSSGYVYWSTPSSSSSGDYLPLSGGTITGTISFGGSSSSYGLAPYSSGSNSIGTSSKYFGYSYIQNMYVNKVYAMSTKGGSTRSYGTAGQVLTSNGSGNLYWSTPSSSSGSSSGYSVVQIYSGSTSSQVSLSTMPDNGFIVVNAHPSAEEVSSGGIQFIFASPADGDKTLYRQAYGVETGSNINCRMLFSYEGGYIKPTYCVIESIWCLKKA